MMMMMMVVHNADIISRVLSLLYRFAVRLLFHQFVVLVVVNVMHVPSWMEVCYVKVKHSSNVEKHELLGIEQTEQGGYEYLMTSDLIYKGIQIAKNSLRRCCLQSRRFKSAASFSMDSEKNIHGCLFRQMTRNMMTSMRRIQNFTPTTVRNVELRLVDVSFIEGNVSL